MTGQTEAVNLPGLFDASIADLSVAERERLLGVAAALLLQVDETIREERGECNDSGD